MITQDIARLIWNCYEEIKSAHKMLEEMKKNLNEKGELELKGGWDGTYSKYLELRIPRESDSWSIKKVPFSLAIDIINIHIKNQENELKRLKDVCKLQLMENINASNS